MKKTCQSTIHPKNIVFFHRAPFWDPLISHISKFPKLTAKNWLILKNKHNNNMCCLDDSVSKSWFAARLANPINIYYILDKIYEKCVSELNCRCQPWFASIGLLLTSINFVNPTRFRFWCLFDFICMVKIIITNNNKNKLSWTIDGVLGNSWFTLRWFHFMNKSRHPMNLS